jgi:exo-beta-1,3-glucanase (GH17 family)
LSHRKNHHSTYHASKELQYKQYLPSNLNEDGIKALFHKTLTEGVHGLCFSLYAEGQKPGDIIPEEQIRRRMRVIAPYTSWVRSFSTTEGNELIAMIAKEYGIKTFVGAWISDDREKNQEEIASLIKLANENYVDIAAVGNEVLYRNDLPKEELMGHISRVKGAIKNVPVGYVDAYYEFTRHQDLSNLCDIILTNCYPFWEGTSFEDAINHMKHMHSQASSVASEKKVIVSETGWPSRGESLKGAVPTEINAMKYFIESQLWSKNENIELFYFSSFDESWKMNAEGEVGAFWGLWDKNEKLKFQ